jgi:hypothetical protein
VTTKDRLTPGDTVSAKVGRLAVMVKGSMTPEDVASVNEGRLAVTTKDRLTPGDTVSAKVGRLAVMVKGSMTPEDMASVNEGRGAIIGSDSPSTVVLSITPLVAMIVGVTTRTGIIFYPRISNCCPICNMCPPEKA